MIFVVHCIVKKFWSNGIIDSPIYTLLHKQTNKGTSIKCMRKIIDTIEDMNIGCSTNYI